MFPPYVRGIPVSEDAFQDAYVALLEQGGPDSVPNPAAWLNETARRRQLKEFRRQAYEHAAYVRYFYEHAESIDEHLNVGPIMDGVPWTTVVLTSRDQERKGGGRRTKRPIDADSTADYAEKYRERNRQDGAATRARRRRRMLLGEA